MLGGEGLVALRATGVADSSWDSSSNLRPDIPSASSITSACRGLCPTGKWMVTVTKRDQRETISR